MKIHIPTPLRQYAEKNASVDVPGRTVAEGLTNLTGRYGDLRRHLFTEDGKLRAFVNVYLNDQDIRYLQNEKTAVKEGDSISIVPSIAGGCAQPRTGAARTPGSTQPRTAVPHGYLLWRQ
jgi:molybdopterin converting factor small subunit